MKKINTYTCSIEYFATGEGFHVYLGVIRATSKQQAIREFRKHFKFFDKQRCWNYFKIGIDVRNGVDRNKLSDYLSPKLISHIKQHIAFENMYFEINFSSFL